MRFFFVFIWLNAWRSLFANCNSRSFTSNCHTHVWMPCCYLHTQRAHIVVRHSIFLRQFLLFTLFQQPDWLCILYEYVYERNCIQTAFSYMRQKTGLLTGKRVEIRALHRVWNEFNKKKKRKTKNIVEKSVFLSMLIASINSHSAPRKWFARVILLNSNNKYSSYQVLDLHVRCALIPCRQYSHCRNYTYVRMQSRFKCIFYDENMPCCWKLALFFHVRITRHTQMIQMHSLYTPYKMVWWRRE